VELQESDAREIVAEISKLLGIKLNIMNSRGFIIASSDERRVGSFHAGAYEIIEKSLDGLEIRDGESWEGAFPGQNFPIRVKGHIIGVVGITGAADETRKYGSIIRKMTEILVSGKAREEAQQNRQKELSRFLADWLNSEADIITNDLVRRGRDFGIDITAPRRIVALYIDPDVSGRTGEAEKKVITDILQFDPGSRCFNSANYLVAVLDDFSDERIAREFSAVLEKSGLRGNRIFAGIAPAEYDYLLIHRAYQYAKRALTASRKRSSSNIVFYDDLGIELVCDAVPVQKKVEFLHKLFRNSDTGKMAEFVRMLKIFYNSNGSLKVASAELNLHPNTLQYRLNRVQKSTGCNPRNYKDALLFQTALLFYDELYQRY
jgi:carbohydrate diacid regulator